MARAARPLGPYGWSLVDFPVVSGIELQLIIIHEYLWTFVMGRRPDSTLLRKSRRGQHGNRRPHHQPPGQPRETH
jgi:hypothetical protein